MTRLRVVVAEDSATDRALLVALLTSDPDITVVGEARTGVDAVKLADQLRPDVITMDIQMPLMDGLLATERIMNQTPTPIVIVSSTANRNDVDLSIAATGAGALLVMEKPGSPQSAAFDRYRTRFLAMVKAMAAVKVVRRWSTPPSARQAGGTGLREGASAPLPRDWAPRAGRIRLVAIAASTGGPAVLQQILRDLPRDFGSPILVVQHIADGFIGGLAKWLGDACSLRVKVAEHRERLCPATVYLAPDDHHLGTTPRGSIALSAGPPIHGFRPSGTFLFQAAARSHGAGVAAVVLTGMGSDGVAGLPAVRESGGLVIAQDESSSVVYGMPREAARAGYADAVLAPDAIAERLTQLVGDRE